MSNDRRKPFPFDEFEPRWQSAWEERHTFHALNPGEPGFDPAKPKYYVLDMFPYPSGSGLHVGHPEGYTATDIIGRYKKMRGFNVLHPMGWDAFGLPAEQHAIKTGEHPSVQTQRNVDNFRRQLKAIGFGYDWQREVNTTDPGYYKWTQWIFLQLYNSWFNPATNRAEPISTYTGSDPDNARLAYVSHAPVNWCPALGTVLANEEVIDGKSEVGGHPVERRPMRQWMLRITAYAQRLIDELDGLDWPDSIKMHQRKWIGRSEGAEVDFTVHGHPGEKIRVFTTRPDTLYGATYMVLAPEHALVEEITTAEQRAAVATYRAAAATKSDLERAELSKDKTGVWTGAFAINPVNGEKIPVWIADYVLTGYGTGAIMAVPAHDERDWEFAKKFALPIREVVSPEPRLGLGGGSSPCEAEPLVCFAEEGYAIHSGPLDGLPTADAKAEIIRRLEQEGVGMRRVNFKLRDWLFSRQRYWGEPFPIVWEGGQHRALDASELPVQPPALEDFKPTGTPEPPLSKAAEWVRYSQTARRELNTMPQWAGSCWYYLRYTDAKNSERFVGRDAERYWMTGSVAPTDPKSVRPGGVDLYVGGTEHAVLHLLYARFWHKVLFDLGRVSTPEPFQKLVNQGLILGELEHSVFAFEDGRRCSAAEVKNIEEEATPKGPRLVATHRKTGEKLIGSRVASDDVEKAGDAFVLKSEPSIRVDSRSFKMSKSRGNVVNPDQVITEYGADSLRLYEMFMGPLEATKPWSMLGVEGVSRFLARVWRLVLEENQAGEWVLNPAVQNVPMDKATAKAVHAAIKKVGEDIETLSFNTAISAMMICTHALTQAQPRPVLAIRLLLQILNPFAPHLTEELHARLNAAGFSAPDEPLLADQPWPAYDPALLIEDEIELPVQVNGKVRDKIVVKADATQAEAEAAAKAAPKIAEAIAGKAIKKVVVVPGRLVNIVVG